MLFGISKGVVIGFYTKIIGENPDSWPKRIISLNTNAHIWSAKLWENKKADVNTPALFML